MLVKIVSIFCNTNSEPLKIQRFEVAGKNMSVPFQVASLVIPPSFPNSIVWSEDNLIAVATVDIVTILNPDQPHGSRGVISLTVGKPFPVGVIDRADLLSGCLFPTCLSRDRQPCIRSLSWSPPGFASNHGCLLAVCSTDGRVKLYRQPYCEFQAEWIELMDLSDMLHVYLEKINYGEPKVPSPAVVDDSAIHMHTENLTAANKTNFPLRKEHKRKRENVIHAVAETIVFPSSIMQEGSSVEVFNENGGQHIWLAGRLKCLEGSKALVHFCDTEANSKQQWFEMNSRINTRNHPDIAPADGGYNFPGIRPSMDVARLPEQVLFAENNEEGEILKAGQVVEAWSTDRWLEGVFVGFSDGGLLVRFSGDAMALNPTDVRLAPIWIAEEKSWHVTLVRVHTQELPEVVVDRKSNKKTNNSPQIVSAAKARRNLSERSPNNSPKHLITAHQYASRYSMLASLVISWSPVLQLSSTSPDNLCDFYSLLAVGTKSGDISVWRMHRPPSYSINCQDDPTTMVLVGVLRAHNAWVTALSWGLHASDSSPQILLASGCSNGSVKIWMGCRYKLGKSSKTDHIPFSLSCEVTASDNVLVSALSLFLPVQSPHKVLLAVGKGSGSLEVWTCNRKTKSSKKVGSFDAHVHVVTGLAWAFDGRCLYSCSLDNSVHVWMHHKGSLSEASIPPNNLGIRSFSDLPSISDSCYGLAISPGNLVLAVARRFDAGQLDPMHKKRTQRAGVEFFWIGGQQMEISTTVNLDVDIEACPGFSKDELESWGSKLLWSLNHFECHDKHLVIWDIITAFLAFKECAPKFIKHIVLRWLGPLFECHLNPSIKDISSDVSGCMSKNSSRHLHLFNIFCRRVIVYSGIKDVKVCGEPPNLVELDSIEEEQQWMDLMLNSEKELRERLVSINLSIFSSHMSHPVQGEFDQWNPVGSALMLKWVSQNHDRLHCQLNVLASEVKGLAARFHTSSEHDEAEEQCNYCSSNVPFESPDVAFCQGIKYSAVEATQKHKLARCAVSMQVCPLTPLWFCICCQRQALNLTPHLLFTMPDYPPDFMLFAKPVLNNLFPPKPLCPFCGISLQRLQPDFLLSTSPV